MRPSAMDDHSPNALDLLRQFQAEELIPAMLDVRAEMLAEGDTPDEVVETLARICTLVGIDPEDLRRAMQ